MNKFEELRRKVNQYIDLKEECTDLTGTDIDNDTFINEATCNVNEWNVEELIKTVDLKIKGVKELIEYVKNGEI